jgi:hypothetical protein
MESVSTSRCARGPWVTRWMMTRTSPGFVSSRMKLLSGSRSLGKSQPSAAPQNRASDSKSSVRQSMTIFPSLLLCIATTSECYAASLRCYQWPLSGRKRTSPIPPETPSPHNAAAQRRRTGFAPSQFIQHPPLPGCFASVADSGIEILAGRRSSTASFPGQRLTSLPPSVVACRKKSPLSDAGLPCPME